MQVRVKLPSAPLIHYWKFCRLIAQAVHPRDKDLEGIKCVCAKVFASKVPTSYADMEAEVPYSVTEADLQALAKILLDLPPLHCPMSKEDADLFLNAYVNLPNRLIWIPLLENEKTIFKRKYDHNQVMDRHIQAIRDEHRAGRLVPVDVNYVPVAAVEMGAHLPRQYAIAYLERHGLAYEEEGANVPLGQEMTPTTTIGKAKLSQSDRESIVKRHKIYAVNKVRNRTALLAAEFNVSERTISDVIKKAKEEEDKKVGLVINVENMTSIWPGSAR